MELPNHIHCVFIVISHNRQCVLFDCSCCAETKNDAQRGLGIISLSASSMSTRSARLSPLGNHPLFSSLTPSQVPQVMEVVACVRKPFSFWFILVSLVTSAWGSKRFQHWVPKSPMSISFTSWPNVSPFLALVVKTSMEFSPYLCHQCNFMIHWNCVFFNYLLFYCFK